MMAVMTEAEIALAYQRGAIPQGVYESHEELRRLATLYQKGIDEITTLSVATMDKVTEKLRASTEAIQAAVAERQAARGKIQTAKS